MEFFRSNTPYLWLLSVLISLVAVAAMSYKWLNVYRSYGTDTNVIRDQLSITGII